MLRLYEPLITSELEPARQPSPYLSAAVVAMAWPPQAAPTVGVVPPPTIVLMVYGRRYGAVCGCAGSGQGAGPVMIVVRTSLPSRFRIILLAPQKEKYVELNLRFVLPAGLRLL